MTRKRQQRLQTVPNVVRVPCKREEEEVEKPTTLYLKAPSVISNGLGWSLVTLLLEAFMDGPMDWYLILAPFVVAIGLVITSTKREIEDE